MRTLTILLLLITVSGCASTFSRHVAARPVEEVDGRPLSFDGMVLATIRRNAHNIKTDMSPDDVVTVLGLQALGSLQKTLRDDGADYRFEGQHCQVIVQMTDTPSSGGFWPVGGTIVGLVGTTGFLSNRTAWVEKVVFQQSDETRVSFTPADAR